MTPISIDCEFSGPVPGLYDMIEIGASVYNPRTYEFDTFSGCLASSVFGLSSSDDNWQWELNTSNWWHGDPERCRTLAAIHNDRQSARIVMEDFALWLTRFKEPVLVGWPIVVDAMFVNWYWWKYIGTKPPFSHSGIDLKTMASIILGRDYRETSKKELQAVHPNFFHADLPHTHRAGDDAKEQVYLYSQMSLHLKPCTNTVGSSAAFESALDAMQQNMKIVAIQRMNTVDDCECGHHISRDHSGSGLSVGYCYICKVQCR